MTGRPAGRGGHRGGCGRGWGPLGGRLGPGWTCGRKDLLTVHVCWTVLMHSHAGPIWAPSGSSGLSHLFFGGYQPGKVSSLVLSFGTGWSSFP